MTALPSHQCRDGAAQSRRVRRCSVHPHAKAAEESQTAPGPRAVRCYDTRRSVFQNARTPGDFSLMTTGGTV